MPEIKVANWPEVVNIEITNLLKKVPNSEQELLDVSHYSSRLNIWPAGLVPFTLLGDKDGIFWKFDNSKTLLLKFSHEQPNDESGLMAITLQ